MTVFRRLLGSAVGLACLAGTAWADTTLKWLHIEVNPNQVKIWEEVAREFEAKNPGVKIEMQFLENEAYKAKRRPCYNPKTAPTSSTAGRAAC